MTRRGMRESANLHSIGLFVGFRPARKCGAGPGPLRCRGSPASSVASSRAWVGSRATGRWRPGRERPASPPATGWAPPGWPGPTGTCGYRRHGRENLCPASVYTGWDIHGGYAEYLTVADAYAHPLPEGFSDAELAPLLCAGIIGYRALLRAEIPPGGSLGIWGFGGSAHLAAQIALAQGAAVHVFTRAPTPGSWR